MPWLPAQTWSSDLLKLEGCCLMLCSQPAGATLATLYESCLKVSIVWPLRMQMPLSPTLGPTPRQRARPRASAIWLPRIHNVTRCPVQHA